MSSHDLIKELENAGFEFKSSRGSHHKFTKDNITVIVPHPKKDLPKGTANSILKQAGLK
ncbi:MAG: type II toxin-antitoxin system HicA family toxin [Mangrovibacterium sp.]